MDSVPDRVILVVKASNQQFEDQTVECEPTWSVKRLKEHLHEVYPSKPGVNEQKLIYAGQLLTDKLILKDILRTYEGINPPNHTMHLVYTPKTRQQLNTSTSTPKAKDQYANASANDGLRQRNINSSATQEISRSITINNAIPQQQIAPSPVNSNCPNSISSSSSNVPGYNFQYNTNESLLAQQLAMQNWMQQAYVQYMNQYMNLLSNGVRPETIYMQNQTNPMSFANNHNNLGVPQMPYLPQNFPFINANPINFPNNSIPSNSVVPNPDSPDGNTSAAVPVPPVEQPQQQPPQNDQPQQPRFPNIVQEELPENRDWLDMFYSFSRLLVLLTLVYFYSSPLRCLVVLFIGIAIYLYHTGFFRTAREANNNNAGGNHENNVQQQQQQQQQVQRPDDNTPDAPQSNNTNSINNNIDESDHQQNAVDGSTAVEDEATSNRSTSNPVPEAQNNGTSVIAFIRTFVVSFFVSLLPETPAL